MQATAARALPRTDTRTAAGILRQLGGGGDPVRDPAAPSSAPVEVVAQSRRVAMSAAESGFRTALIGAFAVVALVLSAIGIYGLLAGLVAERRRAKGLCDRSARL